MLRLAHRLFANGHIGPTAREAMRSIVEQSTVMIVDNVAALYAASPQPEWDMREDFPCLMPPMPGLLLEWNYPERWLSDLAGSIECPLLQAGIFAEHRELSREEVEKTLRATLQVAVDRGVADENTKIVLGNLAAAQEPLHVASFRAVIVPRCESGVAHELPFTCLLFLDRYGAWIGTSYYASQPEWANREAIDQIQGFVFHIAYLAISFMHCKNVQRSDATASEGPSAKWLRRQKAPEIRYHVLNIEPMKKVLRTEGNIEETGLKKALHICRGHFSTYSEEKPLFGKYAGRFWIPSHVRGSSEHGTVVKDYEVKL